MVPTKKTLQPLLFIQPWISSATTLTTGKPFHRSMLLLTWMQQIQGVLIFICMGPDLEPWIDMLLLRQWTKMHLSVTDEWNHHILSSLRGFSLLSEAVGEEGVVSGQEADETCWFQRLDSSRGKQNSSSDAAMHNRLLCWVVLLLLRIGESWSQVRNCGHWLPRLQQQNVFSGP